MKNKLNYFLSIFIFINLSLLVFGYSSLHSQDVSNPKAVPQAEKGVMDLRDWDFEKDGRIELNGEWEFYWMEFLNGEGDDKASIGDKILSKSRETQKNKDYYTVPGAWNGIELESGEKIGQDGYASFRLKLLLPPSESNTKLGFHIYDGQGSAYEMYIGDKLVAKNGHVGTNLKEEKPIYLPQYGEIPIPDTRELTITVFISNFTHKNGGFQTPVKLGIYDSILKQKEILRSVEIFLSGVLLIIALYHFSLFFYRKKDKTALWFGILCMVMLLRLVLTGERLFIETFSKIPFFILIRLEYIGFYGLVPPFGLFLYNLFPDEFRKNMLNLIIGYPLLNIAIVLFFPIKYFTMTLPFFHIATLLVMVYITYILIIAVKKKKEGAKLFLFGFSAYFLAAINDLLFYNLQGNTLYVLPLGLFVFIFAQAGALAHRIGEAFNSSEELSEKLEERVEERTQELDQALLKMEKAIYLTEVEKEKADKLLLNILPSSIATELKETNQVKPQYIPSASVLFTDFVGFTRIAENLSPEDLIQELDGCFSQFDEICKHNNLEKLKTIGDAYICGGGLPLSNATHPIDICLAALEFRSFMKQMGEIKKALNLPFWELRIGIHTGPVTAGVIGTNKFTYDIWGDTVNTASRMESSGEPGKVNISGSTYNLVNKLFLCEYRGKVQAKGKGEVDMYFLERIKPKYSNDEDGLVPNKEFFLSLADR